MSEIARVGYTWANCGRIVNEETKITDQDHSPNATLKLIHVGSTLMTAKC